MALYLLPIIDWIGDISNSILNLNSSSPFIAAVGFAMLLNLIIFPMVSGMLKIKNFLIIKKILSLNLWEFTRNKNQQYRLLLDTKDSIFLISPCCDTPGRK